MILDESDWSLTPEEMAPMIETMERYNDTLQAAGAWVSAEGLDVPGNARTVRVSDGQRTVTDGPFGSSRGQVGGLWIIKADSLEGAVEWAKRVPLTNGAIEVRALLPVDVQADQQP